MNAEERAAHVHARHRGPWSWTHEGVKYRVLSVERIPNGVEYVVEASDASGLLPVDNPYHFVNPPTKSLKGRDPTEEMIEQAVRR